MDFDPDAAADRERVERLRNLERAADEVYERFPDLGVPKGRSGSTTNPVLIDWREPDEHAMMQVIVSTWPAEVAAKGDPIPEGEAEAWCQRQLRIAEFYHASFPSKEIHGTPMGLIADMSANDEGQLHSLNVDSHEPNGTIYIYFVSVWSRGKTRRVLRRTRVYGWVDQD